MLFFLLFRAFTFLSPLFLVAGEFADRAKKLTESMATLWNFGKPSYFITMACNKVWFSFFHSSYACGVIKYVPYRCLPQQMPPTLPAFLVSSPAFIPRSVCFHSFVTSFVVLLRYVPCVLFHLSQHDAPHLHYTPPLLFALCDLVLVLFSDDTSSVAFSVHCSCHTFGPGLGRNPRRAQTGTRAFDIAQPCARIYELKLGALLKVRLHCCTPYEYRESTCFPSCPHRSYISKIFRRITFRRFSSRFFQQCLGPVGYRIAVVEFQARILWKAVLPCVRYRHSSPSVTSCIMYTYLYLIFTRKSGRLRFNHVIYIFHALKTACLSWNASNFFMAAARCI